MVIEHKGKLYERVPEEEKWECIGCAFEQDACCGYVDRCGSTILKLVESKAGIPTVENLEVGDRIVDRNGCIHDVVSKIGGVVIVSYLEMGKLEAVTFEDFHLCNFKYYQEPETIEVGGKKYLKHEVEEKLKDLEEIE